MLVCVCHCSVCYASVCVCLQVQLAKLFPRVALSEAVLTSLTLMEEKETLAHDAGLTAHLEPMDMHTYRLEW